MRLSLRETHASVKNSRIDLHHYEALESEGVSANRTPANLKAGTYVVPDVTRARRSIALMKASVSLGRRYDRR